MSRILFELARVQNLSESLNLQVQRSSSVRSGVSSIYVDGAIAARRMISSRLNRASNSVQQLERRIRDLKSFMNDAVVQYNQAETDIQRKIPGSHIQLFDFARYAGGSEIDYSKLTPEQLAALALLGQSLMDGLKWLAEWQAKQKEKQASAPPPTTISPDVTVKYYEFNYDVNDYVVYTSDGKQTKISFSNLENLLYQYNAGKMVEMWPSDVFEQVRGFDGKKIQEFLDYAISQGYDPVTFEYKGKKLQDNPDAHSYVEKRQQYYEDNKEGPTWFLNGVSFGLDFVPVVGNIKAGWEAISGKNAITGEDLSTADRWMAAAGVVLPWARKAGNLFDIAKHGDDVIDAVKQGDRVIGGSDDLRQISSGGLRNEIELTNAQRSELVDYAKSLGFPEENIVFRENWNTGMMYDRLYINTDVLPAKSPGIGTLSANSRVSGNATIAHEIVGHYEAYANGRAFNLYDVDPATYARNFALDEAQASIRAARFAPDLTSTERMTLLRDAITRLKNGGLRIRDVKDELFIQSR